MHVGAHCALVARVDIVGTASVFAPNRTTPLGDKMVVIMTPHHGVARGHYRIMLAG